MNLIVNAYYLAEVLLSLVFLKAKDSLKSGVDEIGYFKKA